MYCRGQSQGGSRYVFDLQHGYPCGPTVICPYASVEIATLKGYFLANLESVQKDVECTFGILK